MSYKIGQVTTARLADDSITSAKLADDSVLSAAIADDQIVAAAIADDQILAAAIATNAVLADGLADNAVDSAAIIDGAVLSAKLEDNISVAGNLVVAGNLSVTGNASEIHLEELKIDEATMTLNREDSTTYSALVSAGDIGLIVKGGSDDDVKMVFDKNGSNPRVNFKDESGGFIEVKGGAGTFTGDLSAASVSFGSGPNSLSFSANTGAVSASGAITATGGFAGDLTGDVTGDVIGDLTGNVTGDVTGDLTGTASAATLAASATALATSRTFALTGDITGSAAFDGTANCSISTTIADNSLVLGTATTGNYVATVAAGSGVNAISVSGSGSETAAVELSAHALLESAVDAIAASGYAGGQEYLALATANDSMSALQLTSIGKSVAGAFTAADVRSAAGLGSGHDKKHGFLAEASCVLVESVATERAGHASYSSGSASAQGKAYKATYLLEAMDSDGTSLTSQVDFTLPLIDNGDTSSTKMRYGQKMQIKVTGELGAGGSVRLTLPSGKDNDTKIDGGTTFSLTEQYQAITIVAGQDSNSKPQYFIV